MNIFGINKLSTTESYRRPGLLGSFFKGGAFNPGAPVVYSPTRTFARYIFGASVNCLFAYRIEYEASQAKYTPLPYATPKKIVFEKAHIKLCGLHGHVS